MSERNGFENGVPCWVDTWQPDADAAVAFYTDLFGWEAEETTPPGSDRRLFMCRLRGRDVTAIGSPPPVPDHTPVWGTYVWVESAEETAAKAAEAGGSVAVQPFESLDGGRIAILTDPAGAVFGIWQPGEHRGAQLVNEAGAWSMSLLNTRDPEVSTAFYRALFGWEPEEMGGGGGVSLMRLPGFEGGEPLQPVPRDVVAVMAPMSADQFTDEVPSHWSIDFWVKDADATAEEAAERGGAVIVPPYDVPGVGLRQAVLADPQGATFSVTRAPGPPSP
jgi:predicted enzyme related to lactoylglutathione lyase